MQQPTFAIEVSLLQLFFNADLRYSQKAKVEKQKI